MTVATARAQGVGGRWARQGRVRIAATIDQATFDDMKAEALRRHHSLAEEARRRLAPSTENFK